jgi:hypothetical protein
MANDTKAFGVITSVNTPKDTFRQRWPDLPQTSNAGQVNAVGEGTVLITNYNGDVACGDYITTSPITGYGMKQADDIQHSYTVAKLTEEIDWASVTDTIDYGGTPYKKVLAAVTYHCG